MSDNALAAKPTKLEDQIRESGRRAATRYRMTREDALATDPHAEPVPGSLEQRRVPDGVAEHQHTSGQRVIES